MSRNYQQGLIAERYSQPYKTVARAMAAVLPEGREGQKTIRRVAGIWLRVFCKPISRFCTYPDVLLIGASKCGTSSMAKHLSSHPGCMPPFFKEVRYFDSSGIPPAQLDLYRSHFPTVARRRLKEFISRQRAWTADYSPTYYDSPHAPRRVREVLGEKVKLIMMVRNPVDRAYSQYRFQRGIGNERLEVFERALDLEGRRIAGESDRQVANEGYFSRALNHYGYLTRSLYLPYIQNWHRYYDRSQLLIVRLEDFKESPQRVYDEVCDFVGLPHHQISNERHNVSKMEEPMSAETRARLVEYFRRHNMAMSQYLGRDMGWDR